MGDVCAKCLKPLIGCDNIVVIAGYMFHTKECAIEFFKDNQTIILQNTAPVPEDILVRIVDAIVERRKQNLKTYKEQKK